MFIAIRKYSGCQDAQEVNRRVLRDLLPAMKGMRGFRSYTVVDMGGGIVASISTFDSCGDAESATIAVRGLVRKTLSDLVPNPPEVTIGQVLSDTRI